MSGGKSRTRGQPLLALGLVLMAWIGIRAMMWESPFHDAIGAAFARHVAVAAPGITANPIPEAEFTAGPGAIAARPQAELIAPAWRTDPLPARAIVRGDENAGTFAPPDTLAAHQLLYLAGMAQVPIARSVAEAAGLTAPLPTASAIAKGPSRWHGDGWFAWRQGSGLPAVASGPLSAVYGGTQAGAVLRYDLARADPRAPQAYLRATWAPQRSARQTDLAAGLGMRPVAALPVRLMAELRATRQQGRDELRPAALAVTELPPQRLPAGFTLEAYGQAGYVGGRNATAFADGQARLDRPVLAVAGGALRLGVGAWGGAQKYAERLDIGPSATLDLRGTEAPFRLSADYRVRVAGNARPENGLAVTISTGF